MTFQKGNKYGNRFKKGEANVNPNGRPKRSVLMDNIRALGKAAPVTEQDIKEGYQWLQGQSIATLQEVTNNTRDYPAFLSIGARELIGKHAFDAAEVMNNRVYGKPRQQQEVTVTNEIVRPKISFIDADNGDGNDGAGC